MNIEQKQELVQALTEMIEDWERMNCGVTAEHVRKVLRSPRLEDIVAQTIKNPKGLFAEQLTAMARCMEVFADNGVTLVELEVCLLQNGDSPRRALVEKINRLNNCIDLS